MVTGLLVLRRKKPLKPLDEDEAVGGGVAEPPVAVGAAPCSEKYDGLSAGRGGRASISGGGKILSRIRDGVNE